MSYTHCPTCHRAFNLATSSSCPVCPVHATPVDATEDIVAAAEQLARAMARANERERLAAADRMARLALAAPGAPAREAEAQRVLRSIRGTIAPPVATPPPPSTSTSFADVALAMFERFAARPRLAAGIRRAISAAHSVRERVRALAA